MKKLALLSFLFPLLILSACIPSNAPVSVWSENPHYFFYKAKPLIFVSSDHHYGAIIDKEFNYRRYFEYLIRYGMNLTRIYPGAMFEPENKYLYGNPLGPVPGKILLPWKKSDQPGADPQLSEAGSPSYKYDLDQWDPEYFERLKDFVRCADEKDIVVEVAFFNGMYADCWPLMALHHRNNIQGIGMYEAGNCGLFTTADSQNLEVMKYQKAYIRKITEELNPFNNLIFDICDEPSLQGLPNGSIRLMPDSLITPWIIAMKDAFVETEKKLPKKHLLGQTYQNLSPDFSPESWCQWLPAEYVNPAEKALKKGYSCNKPIVDVESNYLGLSLTKNPYTAESVRLEGWWFLLGGGAGFINLNGELFRGQEEGSELTRTTIAPQKKNLKAFMDKLNLAGVSRYEGISIHSKNARISALAEEGRQYAIYLFHGTPEGEWGSHFIPLPGQYTDTLHLRNVPSGSYAIDWTDPASGKTTSSPDIEWNGGTLELPAPVFSLDIACYIRRK